jgi:TetR/AcrR family transcriptional regulator, transcriptional repressor for nem operon
MGKLNTTRQRLLETAVELIWNNSYGSVGVDDICKRAKVQKGSFYHFFPSKADLAVAAFDCHWEQMQPAKDRYFAADIAPLDRIEGFCNFIYQAQTQKKKESGKVLGCLFTSTGSELSTQDKKIRLKIKEMSARNCELFEKAIRDAQKLGQVPPCDAAEKAQELYAFLMGVFVQAKIEDNAELFRRLKPAFFRLLGVKEAAPQR